MTLTNFYTGYPYSGYTPIEKHLEKFWGVSVFGVILTSSAFMVGTLFTSIFFPFLAKNYSLRNLNFISLLVLIIGSVLKMFMFHWYWYAIIGQFVIGMAVCIVINIQISISFIWFCEKKRSVVLSIISISNLLGKDIYFMIWLLLLNMIIAYYVRKEYLVKYFLGSGVGNIYILLFLDDNPNISQELFESQLFNYNLCNFLIPVGLLFLSIFIFKEESMALESRNTSIKQNLKALVTNKNCIKTVLAVSISNACLILVNSIINIVAVDYGFTSTLASYIVLGSTFLGLISSALYGILFKHSKRNYLYMALMMIACGLCIGLGIFGLKTQSKFFFIFPFGLFGLFAYPNIPFMMEKTSMDCSHISLNVINLGKHLFYKFWWYYTHI